MIASQFVDEGHILDLTTRSLLADLATRCADLWRKKDGGIWELTEPQHYTLSKIGCWTALNKAVKLAEQGQILSAQADRWRRERDRIRDWIDAECWSDSKQSYTFYAGTEKLDAGLTLGVFWEFERQDRLASTCAAIKRELGHGPTLFRYSGMAEEEGTFTACGYWMAEADAMLGNLAEAERRMEALLALTSTNLGLLTEQLDPATGAMLGNMPQALSHLSLVLAADAIEQARMRADRHDSEA